MYSIITKMFSINMESQSFFVKSIYCEMFDFTLRFHMPQAIPVLKRPKNTASVLFKTKQNGRRKRGRLKNAKKNNNNKHQYVETCFTDLCVVCRNICMQMCMHARTYTYVRSTLYVHMYTMYVQSLCRKRGIVYMYVHLLAYTCVFMCVSVYVHVCNMLYQIPIYVQ